MPKITFSGRIYPTKIGVTFPDIGPVDWGIDWLELPAIYNVTIKNGSFAVECDLQRLPNPDELSWLYAQSLDLLRGFLDLYSFASGRALFPVIEQFVGADGIRHEFSAGDTGLSRHCTAYTLQHGWLGILKILIAEPPLQHALRDLVDCIAIPHQTAINCTRVVETLRDVVARPRVPKEEAWPRFRDALHISQVYLRQITDASRGPRHGNRWGPHGLTTNELVGRTWIVMNRFLELRKRRIEQLPLAEFPLLA